MIKQIMRDIGKGENITLVGTIFAVIIALMARTLGFLSDSAISSLTLATLGLVATGFLFLRYRIIEILNTSQIIDTTSVVQLLSEFPENLDTYMKNSNEIWMLGISLRKSTYNNYENFLVRVKNDLKIRALLINPHSRFISMETIAESYSRNDLPAVFASEYEAILERYKALRKEAVHQENVQVGLLDFVPPFSLYIFPHQKKEGGAIFVQIYAYKAPIGYTPYFMITQRNNPTWYERFCKLYEVMWENAADYFSDTDY